MAWRLSIKQYDNTTFKDEETGKSKVGRLKTEVLIEEDGIGESWGHWWGNVPEELYELEVGAQGMILDF